MTDPGRRTSRYQSLRTSRLVLARMAPLVRVGLWGIAVSVFLGQVRPLLSDAQFTWGERRVMGVVALFTFGGFALGGWVAGRLLKASAELIDLLIDGADAAWRTADLIELQMVPALGRIAGALERAHPSARDDVREGTVAAIRRTIAAQRWDHAESLIAALTRDTSSAAEASALRDELGREREALVERLTAELKAARHDQDAGRVIDARDALTLHLRGERLVELDRQVVRWLASVIDAQVQSGRAGPDVIQLAARVADSFGDTAEGSRLRAALPGLRRSAGLCPRCARKYKGAADACPRCLGGGPAATPLSPAGAPLPKDLP